MRRKRLVWALTANGLLTMPLIGATVLGRRPPAASSLLAIAIGLLVSLGVAWVLAALLALPADRGEGRSLRYTAADIWALDHFCASIGQIKHAMPELEVVHLDLRNVPVLDASSLALLEGTVKRLGERGIQVSIEGCSAPLGAELERRGFPQQRLT